MDISLEDILMARDARRTRQEELRERWPLAAILVATIVSPGKEKRTPESLVIAKAASLEVAREFGDTAVMLEEKDLPTGYEIWAVIADDPADVKRRSAAIEDSHPLGRLFDIDIIGLDLQPLSRTALGLPERRCLLCDRPARWCMRAATHSHIDLLKRIKEMTDGYSSTL